MQPKPRHPSPPRAPLVGLALALTLVASGSALGQLARPATPAPVGPPVALTSYAPADGLFLYLEHAGLDSQADAWAKTSAYKILNDTPTGLMLEDVTVQLLNQTAVKDAPRKIGGSEAVALAKHLAKHGFLFAAWGKADTPGGPPAVLVLRGVFKSKEIRPTVARLLNAMADPKVKAKAIEVDGHRIVLSKTPKGEFIGWWVDDARKEDLIIIPALNSEAAVSAAAATVFSTLDGKAPNASANPARDSLAKGEDGFVPVAFGFMDFASLPPIPAPPDLGIQGLKAIDLRMGFQDKELVSIARVSAPAPRQGLLALFDQPTFAKTGLPPIPEGVTEFSVFSLDTKKTFDQISSLARALSPQAGVAIDAAVDQVKTRTRLRLKEDLLGHLGPKFAIYSAPSRSSGDASKIAAPNPLSALLGGASIPRITLVAEIDNPAAFGKALDELMILVNQTLRSAIPTAGVAGNGDTSKPASKTARGAGSGLEFKLVPGTTKAFMLTVPSEFSALIPSYVRPTIRVGPKHVVFSIAADSARAALEVKGGGAPETTYATTLQSAPANLVFLSVDDPSETLSSALAAFPGKLQAAINNARTPAIAGSPMPGSFPGGSGSGSGGPPGYPGGSGSGSGGPPGYPGGSGSGSGGPPGYPGGSGSGSGGPPGYPGGSGSGSGGPPGYPGGSGSGSGGPPGYPGGSGSGSGSGSSGTPATGGGGIVFQIDPAKMPTAAAIRPFLFPGSAAVSVDDAGIRLIKREAFPNLGASVSGNSLSSIISKKLVPAAPGVTPGAVAPAPAGPADGPASGGAIPPKPGIRRGGNQPD